METVLLVSLGAGALAGLLIGSQLKFADFGGLGAFFMGAIGGGVGLVIASRIAATTPHDVAIMPGSSDAIVSAITTGGVGGAAMVAFLGIVRAILAEG